MKKNFDIPKLPDGQIDFKKMTEEEGPDDIENFFTKSQLDSMSEYEKLRYCNMKKNYEMMIRLGLPAQKPDFMEGNKKKRKQAVSESGSDEEWKPGSRKHNRNTGLPAQKPNFMIGHKKKKKQRIQDSDSEEEWKPNSEKLHRNSGLNPAFKRKRKEIQKNEKQGNHLISNRETQFDQSKAGECKPKHRYPQRSIPVTNYMYLEFPDDDEFIYCEDCEREYEGDCPVHSTINISDSKTSTKSDNRAVETLPEGLSVRESGIPNAGLGVWSNILIPNRSSFGPYEGEITKDAEKSHSTGYAWQVYIDCLTSHFIDAFDKSRSNWMRYVNCARNEEEQNLVAYQYKGGIYYRSFKEIRPGTELLVWYGMDYGKDLGIERFDMKSFLKPKIINGEEIYGCPLCKICFSSDRYLSNHLKFRHSTRAEWLLNPVSSKEDCQWSKCDKNTVNSDKNVKQIPKGNIMSTVQTIYKTSEFKSEFSTDKSCHKDIKTVYTVNSSADSAKFKNMKEYGKTCVDAHGQNIDQGSFSHVHMRFNSRFVSTICHSQKHTDNAQKCEISNEMENKSGAQRHNEAYRFEATSKQISEDNSLQKHMTIYSGSKPYVCNVCCKGLGDNSKLQTHMRTHIGDKPYKYDVCGKGLSVGSNLQTHMGTHAGEKPYKCDLCGKGFSHSSHLQTHMRTHNGDKPYKCDLCGKGFSQSSNLQTHMRTHNGDKPYKCDVCGKGFSHSSHLLKHMRTHNGDKPYKCDVCGKGFSQSCHLQTHMTTHNGDKPYKCDICGKGFSQSCNLQTHMRTHNGEKPYKCDLCGKGFSHSSHLQTHMRTHNGDKPYKCDLCGKGFSQSSNLQTHMRTHNGDKPYKCDVCGKGFSHSSHLLKHMRTHNGDKPYKCDVCGKGFSQSCHLQTHMTTHNGDKPYKCDVCGKGLSRRDNLQIHMRTHTGDKPYKCDLCGKGFSHSSHLQIHMRTHTGDKPYKCDVCGKGFGHSSHLQMHMRTHNGD